MIVRFAAQRKQSQSTVRGSEGREMHTSGSLSIQPFKIIGYFVLPMYFHIATTNLS